MPILSTDLLRGVSAPPSSYTPLNSRVRVKPSRNDEWLPMVLPSWRSRLVVELGLYWHHSFHVNQPAFWPLYFNHSCWSLNPFHIFLGQSGSHTDDTPAQRCPPKRRVPGHGNGPHDHRLRKDKSSMVKKAAMGALWAFGKAVATQEAPRPATWVDGCNHRAGG